jgi:tetratricopeptide (TPR) repeat protein
VTLAEIRAHKRAGDTERTLNTAEAYLKAHRWGRSRDAVWLLVGMLHREAGRHNAASEAFTKVRVAGGPLAPWAAFYEAEQDLERGKPWVAIRECERYREHWPEGPHASACLRIAARAWVRLGRASQALEAAEQYDADHEEAPITEQIELQLAEWEVEHAPEAAIKRLRELAVKHTVPLTGRYAEELLAQLEEQGVEGAVLPDDTTSLKLRAISLRDAGRRQEAWKVWEELARRAEDDPRLQWWIRAETEVFGWRTRNWSVLAEKYQAEYDRHPTGDMAWSLFRALGRGGEYGQASDLALKAQAKHGRTRHWRYSQEEVGRALMLAGRYDEATTQFDRVARRGGWTGRRGRYEAALSATLSSQLDDAVARFDEIIRRNRSYLSASRYWRSQALEDLGRPEQSADDRAWILENDPDSWYALLVRQGDALPETRPFARDGCWPGPALPTFPSPLVPVGRAYPVEVPQVAESVPVARFTPSALFEGTAAFGTLTWPMRVGPAVEVPEPAPVVLQDLMAPPPSYRSSVLFDEQEAERELYRFAQKYDEAWPHLPAIHDLASVGLYDLAGPAFAEFYEDWFKELRYRNRPNHAVAVGMRMEQDDWRPLFLYVRDHHHTARFTHGLDEDLEDEALRKEALRLTYPLAHASYVWAHGREHDIDPYLALATMRQESTYNPNAVSRKGARGAMQIMPRTGHLLADRAHHTHFTAGDLEDPVVAVGYGLKYLGLLMERFDSVYPLAVASYNGGPHNVSAWLAGTGTEMPMDAFVEHIPFRETRGYVMKVSENYATYLALYAPEGTQVVLPAHPRGNDPTVVDF